jgi:membrane fusion protein (multidrug efflux system)
MSCGSEDKTAEDKKGSAASPPPAVLVAPVLRKTTPIYTEYVGRTEALETVEIRARVEGFLEKIHFEEGEEVEAGQLLYLIDQRPYKAALLDAKAALAQAQAALGKANKDVDRLRPLVAQDAAPRQDLDKAEAEVQYSLATVEKAKAAITKAELDLEFTKIRSPITGIIGKHEVTVGNLISKDQTKLTTISSWDPMRVVFSISESDYLVLARKQSEKESKQEDGTKEIPIELIMADNSFYPHRGELSFVARALDLTTGTLNIYVSFPNPDKLLRPGSFGRIRVMLQEQPNALLVPQKSVQEMQGVNTVMTVGEDNMVALRTVALGSRYEDYYIVADGLKPEDRVIVEGLQKAIPGQKVTPTDQATGKE